MKRRIASLSAKLVFVLVCLAMVEVAAQLAYRMKKKRLVLGGTA